MTGRVQRLLQRTSTLVLNHVPAALAARLGADTKAARLLRPVVNRLVPRQHVVAVVRSGPARGIRLLIEPRGEKFYWTGWHERPVQVALTGVLREGDVFWDVGAHIGLYTVLGSRAVGPGGRVHAFEPMPGNRARLSESLRLNRCNNVTAHAYALAAEPGEARLYASDTSTTWSLVPPEGATDYVVVQRRTLDDVAQELDPPDVLKIDAEGVEVDVLRGGTQLLAQRPPTVIFELLDDRQLEEARALLAGHAFSQLDGTHWLVVPPGRTRGSAPATPEGRAGGRRPTQGRPA